MLALKMIASALPASQTNDAGGTGEHRRLGGDFGRLSFRGGGHHTRGSFGCARGAFGGFGRALGGGGGPLHRFNQFVVDVDRR